MKDLNERARIREATRKAGVWPPQTGVRPLRQENKLLVPTAFSPVREPPDVPCDPLVRLDGPGHWVRRLVQAPGRTAFQTSCCTFPTTPSAPR